MQVNNTNSVNQVYPQYEKSRNGKLIGGLLGTTAGAAVSALFIDEMLDSTDLLRKNACAAEYIDSPSTRKLLVDSNFLENFIEKAMKTSKKNGYIQAGLIGVGIITAGLALGSIFDAIANGARKKKAKATVQQNKLDVVQ